MTSDPAARLRDPGPPQAADGGTIGSLDRLHEALAARETLGLRRVLRPRAATDNLLDLAGCRTRIDDRNRFGLQLAM